MKALALLLALTASSAWAGTAFFTHDEVKDLNRICYYDSARGTVVITVRASQMCPLSIQTD